MLHDWTSTSESYAGLALLLDMARYTWRFPDLRGYGCSRRLSSAYTSVEAAGDILRLAERLDWAKLHFAHHSMSGQIVQRAAMMHPERLAGLTCITPAPASGVPIDAESCAMFRSAAQDEGNWKTIPRRLTGSCLPEGWSALKHVSLAANVQVILEGHDMEVFHEGPMR